MIREWLMLVVFVALFYWLIKMKPTFFANKIRLVQVELAVTLVLSVFLFISAGFNLLFIYVLFWVMLALGSYVVYQKYNEKMGFIGLSFCLYFTLIFIYLEFYLLNFSTL